MASAVFHLTDAQKAAVRNTWEPIKSDIVGTGLLLFQLIFEKYPSWEGLFDKFKVEGQPLLENEQFLKHIEKNVMLTFTKIVDGLDEEAQIKDVIYKLGGRHASRNLKREHFEALSPIIIDTLKKGLGALLNPESEEAWTQLLKVCMNILSDGLEQV